jgi:hypothetical protein
MERTSESVLPIDGDNQLTDFRPPEALGEPGEYPFNRGVYPPTHIGRPRTGEYQPGEL